MTPQQLRFPGQEITGVAVAIRWTGFCTHSGVLYRHTNGQLFLLHLGGDCDLSHEVFEGNFAWVIPDLLPEEVDEIRNVCRAIARTMPQIHYSFRFDPEAKLDATTLEVISQLAPHGLTCSTFVLAVFNSANVRMIDLKDWQQRPQDEKWYGALWRYMSTNGVDTAHLDQIRDDVKCLRVRPEETAAACLALRGELPADFGFCEPRGQEISRAVRAAFDSTWNRSTRN